MDVHFTYVGDDNYFYDLENDLNSASSTKLLQEATLYYQSAHWTHQLRAQRYQLLHPLLGPVTEEDYARLPQWSFNGYYPNVGGATFTLDGEWTQFEHPLRGFREGHRIHLRPGASMPMRTFGSFLVPRFQLDGLFYQLDNNQSLEKEGQLSRIIPIVDVDSGLIFDKYYPCGGRLTLEPRLYYLFVPLKDQDEFPNFDTNLLDFGYSQLFRNNRFSGRDRLGDANQLTASVTSRWLNRLGQEKIRMSVGEIFYFRDRRVQVCAPGSTCTMPEAMDDHFSSIIADVSYHLTPTWQYEAGLEFDPNRASVDKGYAGLRFSNAYNQLFNLNYYWMRQDPYNQALSFFDTPLHQADASFVWPLGKRIDVLAQARYDIEQRRFIELLGGFEYDSCCLAFQLVGTRTLRPNDGLSPTEYANGIFFQVMFKGLSSFGTSSVNQTLHQSIPNYRDFSRRSTFG